MLCAPVTASHFRHGAHGRVPHPHAGSSEEIEAERIAARAAGLRSEDVFVMIDVCDGYPHCTDSGSDGDRGGDSADDGDSGDGRAWAVPLLVVELIKPNTGTPMQHGRAS